MSSTVLVATIVAAPQRAALSDASLARVKQALPGSAESRWLDSGVAADLIFSAGDLASARTVVETLAHEIGADAIVQPRATRAKKLLVADMDSTLIGQECIDELAAGLGLGSRVAEITERAMRGELEFEESLSKRVAMLAGLPEAAIAALLATRIILNPGAKTLFATMRARGGYVAVVSGGFTPFTAEVARRLGAHEHRSNTLGIENVRLTGEVITPILGAAAKREALDEISSRLGLARHETMAVGDGANDLQMLAAAGLGVAYRAKPKVAAAADARVDHADLTALLYAQGIAKAEFVEG